MGYYRNWNGHTHEPRSGSKRHGIFIHQSQKDSVPFQGSDDREFWQRAEERNANTAKLYAQLGLTQYAAMEAFVRWKF